MKVSIPVTAPETKEPPKKPVEMMRKTFFAVAAVGKIRQVVSPVPHSTGGIQNHFVFAKCGKGIITGKML